MITRLYAAILYLYPSRFRAEFGEEMQAIFAESIDNAGETSALFIVLRELRDLPGTLFELYSANWLRGGAFAMKNELFSPSTRRQALLGALPFLAFGAVSMLGKIRVPYLGVLLDSAFYLFAIAGMVIGWKRKFPLWSYTYLGWSLVLTWFMSMMSVGRVYVGYFYMIAFAIAVLVGILWTRSIEPIAQFLSDLSKDMSRLSLAMYAFIAFMFLIYDENRHPYLLLFMAASTAVLAAGAWFFLRSSTLWGRAISVWGGLIASLVISQICEQTWDAAAYYGRPAGTPDPWFMIVYQTLMILSFFTVILLWPALVALLARLIQRRPA